LSAFSGIATPPTIVTILEGGGGRRQTTLFVGNIALGATTFTSVLLNRMLNGSSTRGWGRTLERSYVGRVGEGVFDKLNA